MTARPASIASLPVGFTTLLAATLAASAVGCYDPGQDPSVDTEPVASQEQRWDSQDGNPTHATHSYMSEFAIDQLRGWYPELQTYRSQIIDGSNRELHELPIANAEQEALRIAVGGTNWGCDHPEVLWTKAKASYAAGDKAKAWWYTGIVLHFVQDMGAPAHTFHVIHQGSISQKDNFELLALQSWSPNYGSMNRTDPVYATPDSYVAFSGDWTAADFYQSFPGKTYTRTMFASSWLWASSAQKSYVRNREGRTAMATQWAMLAAVAGFAEL